MKELLALFCAVLLICAMLCGCGEKTVDDAEDTVSSAASEIKDNAEENGMVDDDTDGSIGDNNTNELPTMADLSEMADNGEIASDGIMPTAADSSAEAESRTDETVNDNSGEFL